MWVRGCGLGRVQTNTPLDIGRCHSPWCAPHRHWCRTQIGVGLSSCESELNAALKIGTELIGLKNMLEELDASMKYKILGDSSPPQGFLERRGSGRVKHVAMKQLWLQERIRAKELVYQKIPRALNPSDAGTHHWTRAEGERHFSSMGIKS